MHTTREDLSETVFVQLMLKLFSEDQQEVSQLTSVVAG
jgi:hypothetical protein